MPDPRRLVQEEMARVQLRPFTLETFQRTRERKRRNQRIGTAVVALVIAAVAIGGLLYAFGGLRSQVPASTPTNGRIAFVSPGDGGPTGDLYTVAADGSGLRLLPHYAEYPDWSPDGTRIAFDDGRNLNGSTLTVPNGHVFTVNADATGLTQVTAPDVRAFSPSWSPDGTQLVVAAEGGARSPGIFILDPGTGDMTQLTENPYPGQWDAEPDYSPDGARIAFIRLRQVEDVSSLAALFVMNADGSGLRRLTPWSMDAGVPSWSPDGSTIVFNSKDHSLEPTGSSQIFVIGADGTGLVPLTSEASAASFWPSWAPDGAQIVFTRLNVSGPRSQPFALFTMNADGSDAVPMPALSAISGSEADWGTHP